MPDSQLICSQCGAPFRDADLDSRSRTATCRFCGAITQLPPEPAIEQPVEHQPAPAASSVPRAKVPQPASISREATNDGLRLVFRWFSPVLFFLAFFCVAWDGFLVAWYSMGIGGVARGAPGPMEILFFVFPIAHVAVGAGLTYFTIAGFLNRTWIDVTADTLQVRHGPVPWKGNTTLPVTELDQVYCSMQSNQSNQSSQGTFCVNALLKDGRTVKIVSTLHSADEARYLGRAIEDYLGLEHHPVAGELPA